MTDTVREPTSEQLLALATVCELAANAAVQEGDTEHAWHLRAQAHRLRRRVSDCVERPPFIVLEQRRRERERRFGIPQAGEFPNGEG